MSETPPPASSSTSPPTNEGGFVEANKPFDSSAKADIILRSTDSVDFFVLKIILSLASSVFDTMFSGAVAGGETKGGMPIIELTEDADTLHNLLLLVYPYAEEPTNNMETYKKVGIAAQKYALDQALQRLGKLVRRCEDIEEKPLGIFALAVHFGWVDVIKEAAWNTLAVPLIDFRGGDELRMVTGEDFVDLLQWRFACQRAIDKTLPAKSPPRMSPPRKPKFLQKMVAQSPSGHGRTEMIEKLREVLKDTGCPRSVVVMNESVIAYGLDSVTSHSRSESDRMQKYREVLENAKGLAKEIDEKIAKVPFKIRDKWIVDRPSFIWPEEPAELKKFNEPAQQPHDMDDDDDD